MFKAKVVADSVGPNKVRISSVEMTYPRFIHAEIMTHRDRARNAASSRAIPWKRFRPYNSKIDESLVSYNQLCDANSLGIITEKCMYWQIMVDPVIPIVWGGEQKGMQAGQPLNDSDSKLAEASWLRARDAAVKEAEYLSTLGVHKSLCNRLTEPFMWITVLMTATEWQNFFRLRCHPDAEIHFQKIAGMVRDCINASEPVPLQAGQWHTPYFTALDGDSLRKALIDGQLATGHPDDFMMFRRDRNGEADQIFWKYAKRVSAGRAARISFLTQDGKRDFDEDVRLFQRLIERTDDVLHASPLEHVNEATSRKDLISGCMRGWKTFRSEFQNENVPGHVPSKDLGKTTEEVTR